MIKHFAINTSEWLKWVKTLFLIIVLSDVYDDPSRLYAIPVILICFIGLFAPKSTLKNPWFWLSLLVFVPIVKEDYALAANHHFLEIYILFTFLIQSYFDLDQDYIQKTFKLIFSVLMGLAFGYKIYSSQVLDGSVYHLMWATGAMFKNISPYFLENYVQLVQENNQLLNQLGQDFSLSTIELKKGPPVLIDLFMVYAWLILFVEFILCFIFWTRFHKLGHAILLLFVLFVPIATWENTFLSLVTLLTIPQLKENKHLLMPVYAGIILVYMSLNV